MRPNSFYIDPSSGIPIYRQLIDQIKSQIARGDILPESFLPSVRQVSKHLNINPMTVSKAYSALEKDGVLHFVRGRGMQVASMDVSAKKKEDDRKAIEPLLEEIIQRAAKLSVDMQEVIKQLNQMNRNKKK